MEINAIDKTFVRGEVQSSVAACVKSLLHYFNVSFKQEDLNEKLIVDDKGKTTLADISTTYKCFGLIAEGFQAKSVTNFDALSNPAIIPFYLENGHTDFAIYYGKFEKKYLVGLPFWGLNLYTGWELEAIWENHILLEIKKSDET